MVMKRSTMYVGVGIILAIVVGAFVYFYGVPNYTTTKGLTPDQPISKEFTIHGHSYSFDTTKMEVKQGDARYPA